ncbi:ABC transporter permease [Paenibacillus darwinianus]|uniref:ABC transporter permease n=1 Tax=Paenibacillus darwinianus TaxID=1380763 RepID=A0A9W5S1N1_9BACL|nr:sugar ABC transporter permease [Paenibacillus darwinianus]EXX90413.1 ABC transporter permease [Paenibacillus darwinianus]EXX91067.1 ABC transporter permease [Paenibacillus darwinianus]EXX91991.1 ABC transporter permease [Paenibacillus darwinianus]
MNKRSLTLTRRRALLGVAFILPWLLGFLFLFAIPLVQSVKFSFNELIIAPGGYELMNVGWKNFNDALFVDANFNRILTDSVAAMLVDVPLILFFSLFAATLLNQKFKGRGFARAVFFLPVILASGAIASAEAAGLINLVGNSEAAKEVGDAQSGVDILSMVIMLDEAGMPRWFIDYIIEAVMRIYEIIRSSGVQILIFLAALQSVPAAMYEVAKMEGATPYESFWKITFPMVSPLILTNAIYTIIDSFTDSPVTQTIFATAFQTQNFGLSAAMSWLYTLVVGVLLLIVGVLISRKVFYYN